MLLKQFLLDETRFLSFRTPSAAVHERRGAYLVLGLFVTWLAGVGRYWDSADALVWQQLGLSSLMYVFLLALVIWAAVLPLSARHWSYRNVLLFLTLTAPPALLYAIPVDQFLPLDAARAVNSAFLAIVAAWRVALLFVFLKRVAGLGGFTVAVAALTPLALVVDGISLMNLQHVVYANMVGTRVEDLGAGADVAVAVCRMAWLLTPLLLAGYALRVAMRLSPIEGMRKRVPLRYRQTQ